MAVLQKIRNRGPLLVTILGIALLLFILQIAFEAWGPAQNAKNQNAGEVCGEEITIQDYQTLVEDWKLFYELSNPNINFSESDHDQIRDIAWNQYVNSVIVEKECKKLGLTVTDKEVQEIIETGASSFLNVPVFINSETGKYDYSILQNFLQIYSDAKKQGQQLPDEYEKIYNYYKFAKANIRQEFLNNKYIGLLQASLTSNPIETKQNFDERVNENDILLASIPFTAIDDKDITVEDKDISAKYEEMKETFALDVETRDIKLIDVKIVPSEQDEKNLKSEMDSIYKSFVNSSTNIEVANIVRNNSSKTNYTNLLKTKDAYPTIFVDLLDSMNIGETTQPQFDAISNSFYVIKMVDKATEADSVLYRQIAIVGNGKKDIETKVDSVINALNEGANFKEIAVKYNQTGDSLWMTSNQYQFSMISKEDINFITELYSSNIGETKIHTLPNNASIIYQVLDKKNYVTKYNVASVVKELLVSDATRTEEYNKFSSFLATNNTIEKIEANAAKSNYIVQTINDITNNSHNINNIAGTSSALKWLFDEAEVGSISKLEEGSDNHLLVVYLSKVNAPGHYDLERTKEYLTELVKKDKKADAILEKMNGVTTLEGIPAGLTVTYDTIKHVSFAVPTYVGSRSTNDVIVGAVAQKTEVNKVSAPFKGNEHVFMLKVLAKNATAEQFDPKSEADNVLGQYIGYNQLFNGLNRDLIKDANVKDLRYKFY